MRNVRYLEWRNLVWRKFGAILQYHRRIWHKVPHCCADRERWLLFPMGLGWVAVNCLRLLDGCSYFPGAVGHNGSVHAERATNDTQKTGFGPSNTVAPPAVGHCPMRGLRQGGGGGLLGAILS